ncbi:MAG: insulinase family protein [Alphaproteobacteria bacterium]|nr:insulinase family protein [Alphaproteobacteria bacterium]
MSYQKTILKNGLVIMTSTRPEIETVSLGIWVKTGSAYEKAEENGISHFIEHMVFKGTKKRDALAISEDIENVGGQTNAYTSREFTAFYAKMLQSDIELAVDVISDFIKAPTFDENEMIKEKEVVIQEIKQGIDTPDDAIFDYFQEQAFAGLPLGRTILGPESTVRSFDKAQLRQYMHTHYGTDNMVVVAVGHVDHDAFVKMVEARLGDYTIKSRFEIEPQTYSGGFYAENRDIEQAHVLLGFEGVNYQNEMYYPVSVFSTIFGGGMSSRLFQEIREKRGLVYTVYSFTNSHTKAGLFGIYAGTTADELNALIPVVTDEIKKAVCDQVSDKELSRAKTQLKAGMLMALESSSSTAEVMARQYLIHGRIIDTKETIERIDAVSKDDIQRAAQMLFSHNPTYTLLGNLKKYPSYEMLENRLKF